MTKNTFKNHCQILSPLNISLILSETETSENNRMKNKRKIINKISNKQRFDIFNQNPGL